MSPSEEMVSVRSGNSALVAVVIVEVVVVVVVEVVIELVEVVATQAGASLSSVSPPIGIQATVHSSANIKNYKTLVLATVFTGLSAKGILLCSRIKVGWARC